MIVRRRRAARIRVAVIVFASLLLAFANYCWITAESSASAAESYFAAKCPTDDAVIAWFHTNKKTLDDFLNMVTADDEKVTYVGRGIVEVRPDTSLSEARKQEYLRKLREIRADFLVIPGVKAQLLASGLMLLQSSPLLPALTDTRTSSISMT
jgi:hypothetical protein